MNRNGTSRASNRAEATTIEALDFAHFANGSGSTSDFVFVNVSPHMTRPTLYFYDQEGNLMDPASVVDVTGDLTVTEYGALTVWTAMEPLGELTISTHGRGELVSGSVTVVSEGPIGGFLRYALARHRGHRGGGQPTREGCPLPRPPPGGWNQHRSGDP